MKYKTGDYVAYIHERNSPRRTGKIISCSTISCCYEIQCVDGFYDIKDTDNIICKLTLKEIIWYQIEKIKIKFIRRIY